MQRIKKFDTVFKAVGTAGFSAAAINVDKRFAEQRIEPVLSWILIIILLTAAVKILEYLILDLVGKSEFARKIICGKDYIEGSWLDIVFDSETKEVLFGGIVRISYEDGELLLSGASFDEEGRFSGSFKSTIAKYSDYRLSYTYRSRSLLEGLTAEVAGCGVYDFVPEGDKKPNVFTGYFIDTFHKNKSYLVEGERIIKNVDKISVEERTKLVTDFIERRAKKQRYVTNHLSVDEQG